MPPSSNLVNLSTFLQSNCRSDYRPGLLPKSHLLLLLAVLLLPGLCNAGSPSFLRRGDRWVMAGDSITHNDLYRQKVERIFRHFHPDVPLAFTQVGVSGVTSGHRFDNVAGNATVVSIMLGMNDFINSSMAFGQDPEPFLRAYRTSMEQKVKEYRNKGAVVLLMSPTKTDPRLDHLVYELRGGESFLAECAAILQDIAGKNEGVYYVPVQEEFDALDRTLGLNEILRPDGVHPSAPGQYQIARTLWSRLNIAGDVDGTNPRALLDETVPNVSMQVTLANKMLRPSADGLDLNLKTGEALQVTATWSCGSSRGSEILKLNAGENPWRVPLPPACLEMKPGQLSDVVVDFAAEGKRTVCVIDLSCVPVLHPKNGVFSGEIFSNAEDSNGKQLGTWTLRREGKGLLISGEVADDSLTGESAWPWARDGVAVWLDLRPLERFGGAEIDEDVSMTLLNVIDKPFFGCSLVPWLGRGMSFASDYGVERTPTGYKWNLWVHRNFSNHAPADFSNRDFIGFNLIINDEEIGANGKPVTHMGAATQPQDNAIDKHPNALMLIDLGNKLTVDQVIHASLF